MLQVLFEKLCNSSYNVHFVYTSNSAKSILKFYLITMPKALRPHQRALVSPPRLPALCSGFHAPA